MNILRLVYEWPPPWDGLNPGIYEMSVKQVQKGHRLTVFCGQGDLSFSKILPKDPGFEQGVAVYKFPRAVKKLSLFFTTAPAVLLGYLRDLFRGNKYDLVHGHGHITLCFSIYKLLFGFFDNTPFVLHLHITAAGREKSAYEQGNQIDFWTQMLEWPLHKFSDWLGVRVADRIICTSEEVKKEAHQYYKAAGHKLVVVENGANVELFTPDGSDLKPEFGWENKKVLFYNGVLSERKNVDILVYTLKLLGTDFRLLIVGRGAEEYEKYLKQVIEKKNMQKQVKLAGYIEYPKLGDYFRTADVFVIPAYYEGLPKVVMQSLAAGVPVVASGFKTQQKIPGLYYIEELSPEVVAHHVHEALESDEFIDLEEFRAKYSWDAKVEEIEEVYERVV